MAMEELANVTLKCDGAAVEMTEVWYLEHQKYSRAHEIKYGALADDYGFEWLAQQDSPLQTRRIIEEFEGGLKVTLFSVWA